MSPVEGLVGVEGGREGDDTPKSANKDGVSPESSKSELNKVLLGAAGVEGVLPAVPEGNMSSSNRAVLASPGSSPANLRNIWVAQLK